MNCAELEQRLDDLVEDRLDRDSRRLADEHLLRCPACRGLVDGLRHVLVEARSLPASVEPSTDLWPMIDARLTTRRPGRATRALDWRVLGIAAALALAFVLGGFVLRQPSTPEPGRPAARTDATAIPASSGSPAAFDAAEQALLATKQQLREALADRRPEMSARTAAVVDSNLALIEQAIDEIRVALEEDPANPQLHRMLLAAHQRELALLQRVTQSGRRL